MIYFGLLENQLKFVDVIFLSPFLHSFFVMESQRNHDI